jgi:hypothetical protein
MAAPSAPINGHKRRRRNGIGKSHAKRPRSAITSGRKLFIDGQGDPNSAWSRLWVDLIVDYASDFGGVDALTFRQFSDIQHAASIKCELLRLDGLQSKGERISIKDYCYAAHKHLHLMEAIPRLGERPPPHDVTPSLNDILREHEADAVEAVE